MNESFVSSEESLSTDGLDGGQVLATKLVIPSPISFLPKQMDVFSACKQYDAVLYSGAFRAGKTIILANVSIQTCLDNPGAVGILGSLTDSMARDVVLRTLSQEINKYQKVLDKHLGAMGSSYRIVNNITHTSGKMQVNFKNGSQIFIRSCDEERKLAGRTIDFWGLDEAVDMEEGIFTQLLGRMSGTGNVKHRFGLITTNPGSESHWLYKYFYTEKPEEYCTVETTTYDNVLLPDYHKYIKRLEEVYDPDWVRRYLDGRWGAFSGQIYKDFNHKKHIGDYANKTVKYYIAGVDWGLRHPCCILVGGVTDDKPTPRLFIVDEWYQNDKSSDEVAKVIAEKHKQFHFNKVFIDPSAADLIKQTSNLGVPCGRPVNEEIHSWANRDVIRGISKVKSFLRRGVLNIDRHCYNTIREFPSYRYQRDTDKPVKQDDDCMDALRYLITDFDPFHTRSSFGVVFWRRKH